MKVENNSIAIGRNTYFFIAETQLLLLIPKRIPLLSDFFFSLHNSSVKFTFPNKTELLEKLQKLELKIQRLNPTKKQTKR